MAVRPSLSLVRPLLETGLTQTLDLTAGNLTLQLSEQFKGYGEEDIYRAFGRPLIHLIETCLGKPAGPGAQAYIVKPLDFCAPRLPLKERIIYVVG